MRGWEERRLGHLRVVTRPRDGGCQYCHAPEAGPLVTQVRDADGVIHKTRVSVCAACRIRNFPKV